MKSAKSMFLKILLFPVAVLIACIVNIRNWLYDQQWISSTQPKVFTVSVGNLNLGGTGKTPHVEYLVNLLAGTYKLSVLSRGYKRHTRGFVKADENATAKAIGDEPMQYFSKFKDRIQVAVCEDRVSGVNQLQILFPENQAVVLDDAFQHRKINPHLNLLLCDYNQPFYEDYMVPVGSLRDTRQSAKRADAVIVTKCPIDVPADIKIKIEAGIAKYVRAGTPVFFSSIQYQNITAYELGVFDYRMPITVVTGIAIPEVFHKYFVTQGIAVADSFAYADHFAFSRKKVEAFANKQNPSRQIVTTEKDMVKLRPLLTKTELSRYFYVPITVSISPKEDFDKFVTEAADRVISEYI